MKLHTKLCLICAVLLVVTQTASALFYYRYADWYYSNISRDNLTSMGTKIIQQYEDSIRTMDYTLGNLLSNAEFMNAMSTLANDSASQTDLMEAQAVIMGVLYREPLNKEYYRGNIFNRRGVFYTSRFDNRDTANQLSYDLAAIAQSVPWLDEADASRFTRLLIPPYQDPWTVTREQWVFSAVRSVLWVGKAVGYLEVQTATDTLATLFSTGDMAGVNALALLGGEQILYTSSDELRTAQDAHRNPDDLVLSFHSEQGGLMLILTQDKTLWQQSMQQFLRTVTLFGAIILIVSIALATIISYSTTRSVRRLKRRMDASDFQGKTLALYSPEHKALGRGDEIDQLEAAFDSLVGRLNTSMHNELSAQEMRLQAHFQALQAQINPHFMYNTLNMIAAKSLSAGNLDVTNMCGMFADMLRYSTDINQKNATLEQELTHVGNYLELLKARYGERFEYEIRRADGVADMLLPRVSLQPLVENCVQHGYKQKTGVMKIEILCEQKGGSLVITVRDNGDGFPQEVLDSVGQAIVQFKQSEYDNLPTDVNAHRVGLLNVLARMMYLKQNQMDVKLYNDGGAVIELVFYNDGKGEA